MKDFKKELDKGFSLLELVVAVGILLVLTVGGLLAYNGIIGSARQAAVNNAAETVYNQAMIYKTDDKPDTTIQTAVDKWNKSAGIKLPDEIATVNTVAAIGVNKEKIIVSATDLDHDSFEIKATYGREGSSSKRIEAVRTSPVANNVIEEEDDNSSNQSTYTWGSTSFVCESRDRETYNLDGRIATKYTHEVNIPFALNNNSASATEPLFITVKDNSYYPSRWGGAAEFVSVNDAFEFRQDLSNDGEFVFELKSNAETETLTFEYKDNFWCDRDLTASMTTTDTNVVVPEPLSYGELYQAM